MKEEMGHHDAIRAAWKRGKRKITLKFGDKPITFNLEEQVRRVVYWVGPQNAKVEQNRIDTNVIARNVDGSSLPRISTQVKRQELND